MPITTYDFTPKPQDELAAIRRELETITDHLVTLNALLMGTIIKGD